MEPFCSDKAHVRMTYYYQIMIKSPVAAPASTLFRERGSWKSGREGKKWNAQKHAL